MQYCAIELHECFGAPPKLRRPFKKVRWGGRGPPGPPGPPARPPLVGARNKEQESGELYSKELIKMFLHEERKFYKEIEIIIYCICASAVKLSVESVIESLRSKVEIQFNKFRNVKEEMPYNEMMISVNGLLPSRCDQVMMTAMKKHFRAQNGIHFVKKGVETKVFDVSGVSKVISRMMRQNSRLPFME